MKWLRALSMIVSVAVVAAPAFAADLRVDLRIGADRFTLDGQLTGPDGVYGAWFDGHVRADGLTLHGRVQGPERTVDFSVKGRIDEAPHRVNTPAPGWRL